MRVSLVSPKSADVCQPNEKPLSNPFGDTGFEPVLFTLIVTVLTLHHLSIFYRHTILVVSFDHRKIAISMSYVRIRLYSSAVDVYRLRSCFKVFCGQTKF